MLWRPDRRVGARLPSHCVFTASCCFLIPLGLGPGEKMNGGLWRVRGWYTRHLVLVTHGHASCLKVSRGMFVCESLEVLSPETLTWSSLQMGNTYHLSSGSQLWLPAQSLHSSAQPLSWGLTWLQAFPMGDSFLDYLQPAPLSVHTAFLKNSNLCLLGRMSQGLFIHMASDL